MKKLECVALCNIGKGRNVNQDNVYVNGTYKDKSEDTFFQQEIQASMGDYVYAVVDGMGGLCYGEEAAQVAVSALEKYEDRKAETNTNFSGRRAIYYMNQAVCALGREKKASVGSTATILKYHNRKARIYNVGDSKAFLFRDGSIRQLSEDHTERDCFLKIQKELGLEGGPLPGNGLTQYLGVEEEEFILEPGISDTIKMQEKDIFLLCRDGLTALVSIEEICQVLSESAPLMEKAKKLEQMALDAGGMDNITILVLTLFQG